MALLYTVAGTMHFVRPEVYVRIIPSWVPYPSAAVFLSGVAEIVFGVGLLFRSTRRLAAVGVIVLLIAVFPANVQMAATWVRDDHPAKWLSVARLPLQGFLIWWAWKVRKA